MGAFAQFRPGIADPPTVIFDESKYVEPPRTLLADMQDLNPDGPALGKLILAGSMKLMGDSSLGGRASSALYAAVLVPSVVHLGMHWPYCRLLHLPFSGNQLAGMNLYIWRFHRAVPPNPTIVDHWYRWPLHTEPTRALSYLVGNWYVMCTGLIAWVYCLWRLARNLPETLIVLLYAANFLQWAVTPQGALYYYHFRAALFLGMANVVALHRLPQHVYALCLSVAAVLRAACIFIYCFGRIANLPPPFDCMLGVGARSS